PHPGPLPWVQGRGDRSARRLVLARRRETGAVVADARRLLWCRVARLAREWFAGEGDAEDAADGVGEGDAVVPVALTGILDRGDGTLGPGLPLGAQGFVLLAVLQQGGHRLAELGPLLSRQALIAL